MDLTHHLPALQVIVPMLSAPLILLLKPRGLAWAGAAAVALLSFAIAVNMALEIVGGGILDYDMGGWKAPSAGRMRGKLIEIRLRQKCLER